MATHVHMMIAMLPSASISQVMGYIKRGYDLLGSCVPRERKELCMTGSLRVGSLFFCGRSERRVDPKLRLASGEGRYKSRSTRGVSLNTTSRIKIALTNLLCNF